MGGSRLHLSSFSISLFLALLLVVAKGGNVSNSQCYSLQSLYDSTGGKAWRYKDKKSGKWHFTSMKTAPNFPCLGDPCSWTGLNCSGGADGVITWMSLVAMNLDGKFVFLMSIQFALYPFSSCFISFK